MEKVLDLLSNYQNFVLLGEAGSGKSELALNLAASLAAAIPDREVHLFDLDQTKPLFRSRELARSSGLTAMAENRNLHPGETAPEGRARAESGGEFTIHWQEQVMDSPTMVGGVEDAVLDPAKIAILDVGGGEMGARLIGQFRELLTGGETAVLYLVNPYRPWSRSRRDLELTMIEVLGGSGLADIHYVANPNVGPGTEAEDVLAGLQKIREVLGIEPEWMCVQEGLAEEVAEETGMVIYPVRIRLATSRPEDLVP